MPRAAQIVPTIFVHSHHPWRSQDAQERRMYRIYDMRFVKIEADLLVLKWMVGAILAGVTSLVIKAFFV